MPVIRAYDERATSSRRTSTPANSRSHEAYRSPPCRHGKRFGFAFRVKYCSRTSLSHGRYIVLARAANDHEWSEESYQHFMSLFHESICPHTPDEKKTSRARHFMEPYGHRLASDECFVEGLDPNNLGFDNLYTVRTREMFNWRR